MSVPSDPPVAAGQEVFLQTRQKALDSLTALLGNRAEAEELWAKSCEAAGCPSEPTDFESLKKVADQLAEVGGPAGLVGSSLSIRVHTYRLLERTKLLAAFLEGESR